MIRKIFFVERWPDSNTKKRDLFSEKILSWVKCFHGFRGLYTMANRQAQFEALVHAYSADLYRYAVWLCRASDVAEELVQETFMRAWKALDTLHDSKAAKAWLVTILRRENARRFERKRQENNLIDTLKTEQLSELVVSSEQVEELNMQRALDKLDVSYREPLLLQVLGGYSCEEIGGLLGLSVSAVMTRLFRARQKMRIYLADGAGNDNISDYGVVHELS